VTADARRVALLLDEMFSPAIAAELRRRGHDVIALAADPELRSMTDIELYVWATAEHRRIVTENVKDFRRLLVQDSELTGPGLLFSSGRTFRRSRHAPGQLLTSLENWLTQRGVLARPPEDWLLATDDRNARKAILSARDASRRSNPTGTRTCARL
jgi:hypothetical protein